MAKKSTKTSKANKVQKYDCRRILCHPSTWLAAVLALALLVIYGVSMYGFTHIEPKTELDTAKLAVFDDLISNYISDLEITSDQPSASEATGYGISDEDGVFYTTFDFITYTLGDDQTPVYDNLQHGIIYFWPDTERGTYSHAFSYHDDYYRPGGTYTEIGNHFLRDLIEQ